MQQLTNEYIIAVFVTAIVLCMIATLFIKRVDLKSACVGIGVLGTFVGISLALYDFNPSEVSASIPALLEGLKLAFITSAAGMGAAVTLSIVNPTNNEESLIQQQLEMQREMLVLQQRTIDQQQQTELATREALSNLNKSASSELVAALREVVADFNQMVGDQFFENFSDLRASVDQLIAWQEQHREHLTQHQHTLEQQYNTWRAKIDELSQFEDSRLAKFGDYHQSLMGSLSKHVDTIASCQRNLAGVVNSLESTSAESMKMLSDTLNKANRRIDESVSIAEENLTALIGVANRSLAHG